MNPGHKLNGPQGCENYQDTKDAAKKRPQRTKNKQRNQIFPNLEKDQKGGQRDNHSL